jgi:hypothetical protein
MSSAPQDDIRPFAVFYPDREQRKFVHYYFAHKFVPEYVWQNPYAFFGYVYGVPGLNPMDPTRFIHSRWMMIYERRLQPPPPSIGIPGAFRRMADLSMSIQEIGSRASALITMPVPEDPVCAYFVCVVLLAPAAQAGSWSRDLEARIFTLEMMIDSSTKHGVMCEWTKGGDHRNHSVLVPPTRESFLRAVGDFMARETPA